MSHQCSHSLTLLNQGLCCRTGAQLLHVGIACWTIPILIWLKNRLVLQDDLPDLLSQRGCCLHSRGCSNGFHEVSQGIALRQRGHRKLLLVSSRARSISHLDQSTFESFLILSEGIQLSCDSRQSVREGSQLIGQNSSCDLLRLCSICFGIPPSTRRGVAGTS